MGFSCLGIVLMLLLLLLHKSFVSGVTAYLEEVQGGVEVKTKVVLSEEVTVRSVPINRKGGASGGHGGSSGGHGESSGGHGGNGESGGEHTPNTGGVIPIYAGAASHHGNHHHGAANNSKGSIRFAVTAILTSLLFTFS